jgi:hypothetical protein
MDEPGWLVGYDAAMQLAAMLLAFAIAYFGFRAWKASGRDEYKYFFAAFALLATGLFFESAGFAVAAGIVRPALAARTALYAGYSLFMLFSGLSYMLLFAMYARERIERMAHGAAPALYVSLHQVFNLFSLALLLYPLYRTMSNLAAKRSLHAAFTFAGFLLLSLYHVLYFTAAFRPVLYLPAYLSELLGLAAFLSLFVMVWLNEGKTLARQD